MAKKKKAVKEDVLPWQVYSKNDPTLAKYKPYSVLFGERKFARPFLAERQTLSFTDHLPPEVRLMIYEHAGVLAPGRTFELWGPEVWTGRRGQRRVRRSPDSRSRNDHAYYARHTRGLLGLLRLSRTVRDEAAGLFYGGHEFRFSARNGAAALASWLHTVRPRQSQHLRHVTVEMPSESWRNDYGGKRAESLATCKLLCGLLRERGMAVPDCPPYLAGPREGPGRVDSDAEGWHKILATRAFRYLAEIPGLRRLDLICRRIRKRHHYLPSEMRDSGGGRCRCTEEEVSAMSPRELIAYAIRGHCDLAYYRHVYWDAVERLKKTTRSPELVISVVLLYGDHDGVDRDRLWWEAPWHTWHEEDVTRTCDDRWLAAYADMMGYGFGHAAWKDREYTVEYGEDPRLRPPPPEWQNVLCQEPPRVESDTVDEVASPGKQKEEAR